MTLEFPRCLPKPRGAGPRSVASCDPDGIPVWVVDFTYVATWAGFVYVAFCVDVFARMITGWRASRSMTTDLVLDALEMGIWQRARQRHSVQGLVHHSDAGSQYTSIRYTEPLAEAGARPSIGSVGDSYDNALAESIIGLSKPNSTVGKVRGEASTRSRSQPWMGRLVQRPSAHRGHREHPAGRGRSQPLPQDRSV